jgi:ribosomal protein S18 acetylase RimI-like enzyme
MDVISANQFSYEQLTEAYNQTRVDYLVPMPMNVARLREYSRVYDISLDHSCVAVDQETMLGLGMLGVRHNRAWITRLGVLPNGRRKGTGARIMETLIEQANNDQLGYVWLEVIKGNTLHTHFFANLILKKRVSSLWHVVRPHQIKINHYCPG